MSLAQSGHKVSVGVIDPIAAANRTTDEKRYLYIAVSAALGIIAVAIFVFVYLRPPVVQVEVGMIFQRVTYLGLIGVVVFLFAGSAVAQEKTGPTVHKEWREVFVTVENHTMGVKALEGHAVGVMEQRGLAFYEDGEVATVNVWLTYESKGQTTDYRGYVVYRFRDGATQTAAFEGSGDPVGHQKGKLRFIKGTARFAGIRGRGTFTAEGFPPHVDLYVDAEASYSLPKN